jgi:hypothetical protein
MKKAGSLIVREPAFFMNHQRGGNYFRVFIFSASRMPMILGTFIVIK